MVKYNINIINIVSIVNIIKTYIIETVKTIFIHIKMFQIIMNYIDQYHGSNKTG